MMISNCSITSTLATLVLYLTSIVSPVVIKEASGIKIRQPRLDFSEYDFFTLPDGTMAIICSVGGTNVSMGTGTFVNLGFQVGWMHDFLKFPGIAHLLEHMVFLQDSEKVDTPFEDVCSSKKCSNNAFTTPEFTNYYFHVPDSSDLLPVMKSFANMFYTFEANDQKAMKEAHAVNSERLLRSSWFFMKLMRVVQSRIRADHPQSWENIGDLKDLGVEGIGAAVEKFFKDYYHPDNAALVVVSDLPLEQIREAVRESFVFPLGSDQGSEEGRVRREPPREYADFGGDIWAPYEHSANTTSSSSVVPLRVMKEKANLFFVEVSFDPATASAEEKPIESLQRIMRNEGENGFLSQLLREHGLVKWMMVFVTDYYEGSIQLNVIFELPEVASRSSLIFRAYSENIMRLFVSMVDSLLSTGDKDLGVLLKTTKDLMTHRLRNEQSIEDFEDHGTNIIRRLVRAKTREDVERVLVGHREITDVNVAGFRRLLEEIRSLRNLRLFGSVDPSTIREFSDESKFTTLDPDVELDVIDLHIDLSEAVLPEVAVNITPSEVAHTHEEAVHENKRLAQECDHRNMDIASDAQFPPRCSPQAVPGLGHTQSPYERFVFFQDYLHLEPKHFVVCEFVTNRVFDSALNFYSAILMKNFWQYVSALPKFQMYEEAGYHADMLITEKGVMLYFRGYRRYSGDFIFEFLNHFKGGINQCIALIEEYMGEMIGERRQLHAHAAVARFEKEELGRNPADLFRRHCVGHHDNGVGADAAGGGGIEELLAQAKGGGQPCRSTSPPASTQGRGRNDIFEVLMRHNVLEKVIRDLNSGFTPSMVEIILNIPQVFTSSFARFYCHGNEDASSENHNQKGCGRAAQLLGPLTTWGGTRKNISQDPSSRLPSRLFNLMPLHPSKELHFDFESQDPNHVFSFLCFQTVEPNALKKKLHLMNRLVAAIVWRDFFKTLRTQENFGYSVFASDMSSGKTNILVFMVMSPYFEMKTLHQRTLDYVEDRLLPLVRTADQTGDLLSIKRALQASILDKTMTMQRWLQKNWGALSENYFAFENHRLAMARTIAQISADDIVDYLRDCVLKGGTDRRAFFVNESKENQHPNLPQLFKNLESYENLTWFPVE